MKTEVGMVIRVFRKLRNLKQDYMAHKLDISVNTYANIEKGRVDINTAKLFALAEEMHEFGEHNWMPPVAKRMIRIS